MMGRKREWDGIKLASKQKGEAKGPSKHTLKRSGSQAIHAILSRQQVGGQGWAAGKRRLYPAGRILPAWSSLIRLAMQLPLPLATHRLRLAAQWGSWPHSGCGLLQSGASGCSAAAAGCSAGLSGAAPFRLSACPPGLQTHP